MIRIFKILILFLLVILLNYLLLTRDGSIRLGILLSGYNPFISYENIDYENGNSYLNQIEIDEMIIYLECKSYGPIKTSSYYSFNE